MIDIKEHIPKAVKQVYRSFRNPDSDALFNLRYRHKRQHTLESQNLKLLFDTSTLIAKRWFFPRYSDGSLHEPVVSKKLISVLDTDSVFFDVGANVGYYSVLASQRCKTGHVHSFELDPRLASIIASHFELSSAQNATITCAGVSDSSGEFVSFTPHQSGNLSTNTVQEDRGGRTNGLKVPSLTLDKYCSKTEIAPDVLKIDVEGFERQVLEGGANILEKSPPRALFLELHPNLVDNFGIAPREILSLLNEFGYTCYRFADHRSHVHPADSLSLISTPPNIENNCMLYCSR
ncbi:FkbM family methyltransferase [Halorussus salinisoli]|uniref:FkbM family methyltransferase n=1 Tax=Halorussus salinisoli TaxID=2558242 RepID=UPI0010C1610A